MALSNNTAATVESTPPDKPKTTLSLPTFAFMACYGCIYETIRCPCLVQRLQCLTKKFSQQSQPIRGVVYFWVELNGVGVFAFNLDRLHFPHRACLQFSLIVYRASVKSYPNDSSIPDCPVSTTFEQLT